MKQFRVVSEFSVLTAEGHVRPLAEIEHDVIILAVFLYDGNMTEIARRLRVGRSTVYRRLQQFGIDVI